MIHIIDNFFAPWQLKLVTKELKSMPFYSADEHPQRNEAVYPGKRTDELVRVNPLLESFLCRRLDSTGIPPIARPYQITQYGHLRLDEDNKEDFIHTDVSFDWAFLLYISSTNLESGTKFYSAGANKNTPKDSEDAFIKFKQNRMVVFDATVPHMAWGNHGKDLDDGRLTINGFSYYI